MTEGTNDTPRVTVLGSGSWGTALAAHLAAQNYPTRLWSRRAEQAEFINLTRKNPDYLKDLELPEALSATGDLEQALQGADLIVVAVPTAANRQVLEDIAPHIPEGAALLSATKGIEQGSLKLVSEIFEEVLPERIHGHLTYLGGPSFAREVVRGVPTAVSIAGKNPDVLARVANAFNTDRLRVYTTDDVVGVEVGGALKNVVAIATGIADGMGLGHNSRAAIITRGLAELTRLAVKLGAHPMTLSGLSGMGDLVLTCTGDLSRNRRVGLALGAGKTLAQVLEELGMVAEGVKTAESARALAERLDVDMPITDQVYRVIYEDKPAKEALEWLMTRPMREERE